MSFIFGGDAPAPAPLPEDPSIAEEARKKRDEAAALAAADQRAAGRRSTMVAGMSLAAEEQGARGLMAKSRREASRSLVG